MRRFWKLAAVTALAVIVGPVMAAMPAWADGPSGYGFDDTPHVDRGWWLGHDMEGHDRADRALQHVGRLHESALDPADDEHLSDDIGNS